MSNEITPPDLTAKSLAAIETEKLEKKLKQHHDQMALLVEKGKIPDLSYLTWELYSRFKEGVIPKYFEDDEEEIQKFYKYKREELILNLSTFLSLAVNHMLDPDKLSATSVKDLSYAVNNAVQMLTRLVGQEAETRKVKHEHTVTLSPEEVQTKLKALKEKIETVQEAEFEEVKEEMNELKF